MGQPQKARVSHTSEHDWGTLEGSNCVKTNQNGIYLQVNSGGVKIRDRGMIPRWTNPKITTKIRFYFGGLKKPIRPTLIGIVEKCVRKSDISFDWEREIPKLKNALSGKCMCDVYSCVVCWRIFLAFFYFSRARTFLRLLDLCSKCLYPKVYHCRYYHHFQRLHTLSNLSTGVQTHKIWNRGLVQHAGVHRCAFRQLFFFWLK